MILRPVQKADGPPSADDSDATAPKLTCWRCTESFNNAIYHKGWGGEGSSNLNGEETEMLIRLLLAATSGADFKNSIWKKKQKKSAEYQWKYLGL